MSVYSGCTYVHGKEVADAVEFLVGNRGAIAAISLWPYMSDSLLQQFPWLKDVPKEWVPPDWEAVASQFEAKYGISQTVKDNGEQLNGIT